MANFIALFLLEFKRFTRPWKLAVLLSLAIVSLYGFNKGMEEYNNMQSESEKFQMCEALIFKTLMNYNEYGHTGVGVFFLPSPAMSLFTNPPKISELAGSCNSAVKLDVGGGSKNRTVTRTNAPFPLRFSVIVLLIGTLAGLFIGFESMRSPEYLKFLSGNAPAHQVFFSIAFSRYILIALSFLAILLLMLGAMIIHKIPLTAVDFPGLISYTIATLIMLLFFFFSGTLAGNIRGGGAGNTALLAIWFTFVLVVPGILDSIIVDKSDQIPSPYELYENKLRIVNNFERQSTETYGKFNKDNMETERKIVEDYWNRVFKEIETREEQHKNKIEQVIEDYNTYSIFSPTTFYNLATGEASSRGFGNYREFYSYMQKTWKAFARFWIDRVYYNDPKQMANFIKTGENIYKSHSRRPDYFLKGVLVNSGYIIILYLVSAFLFKKSLTRLTISKQEQAGLDNIHIKADDGDLKILLTGGHHFRDILYNALSGNNKEINKTGITGEVLINGTDHFAAGAGKEFLYLCRFNQIPGDIKVGDLIAYYARVQKASREELKTILDSPEIKPIRRKYLARLKDTQEFHPLSALLQVKRKQVYLIDDLSTGYPAECAIRLREQMEALCAAGAIVIYLISTIKLPEGDKITGPYHDGMHWLYMVEERKATFKIEQKIQKEKELKKNE